MTVAATSRPIAAPAEVVWELITNIAEAPAFLAAVTAIETFDDGRPFGVGTRWRETRLVFGRPSTQTMEVIACDPPRTYTVFSTERGTEFVTTLVVTPRSEGCDVRMTSEVSAHGLIARVLALVMAPVLGRTMARALQQDLDDIAAAAERTAEGDRS